MTLYTCRRIDQGRLEVTKFLEDKTDPEAVYPIFGSKCSCLGAIRQPHCRHIQVLEAFRARQQAGDPTYGFAYDFENGRFIQVVPLEGVVNIKGLIVA